ncbi:MAG: efflux RND transporter periplasmic adaptor subunit [Planctomycetota bacterium]|jgi:HlyD family secretion protein
MNKWFIRVLVLAGIVAAWMLLKATLLAPDPVVVRAVAVERGTVEATVTNSKAGTIEARRRAKFSPGTSGIVTELHVRRGDVVDAGAPLLHLDDATQQAEMLRAQRSLDVARADHRKHCIAAERAQRELERNKELLAEELISVDVVDGLENAHELAAANCDVAAAEVERQRAVVGVARAELDKTILRAPFEAIIAEVSVELGEWVTPSVPLLAAPDLIDAIDPTSLYVAAPMDEVDAGLLSAGLPVRVTIDSHAGQSFPAHIARVAPYVLDIEQQNRTLEIEVELDDAAFSRTLLPGTSADVEVILQVRDDVLRIPTFALLEGGRVLVVEDGVLVERAITVGLRNWDWAEVTSGLSGGELVVTSLDRAEVVAGAEVELEQPNGEP